MTGALKVVRAGLFDTIQDLGRIGHMALGMPTAGAMDRIGLTLANAPGLIDAGYRGEVVVAVVNLDRTESVKVAHGDRIAQLVIVALPLVAPSWVSELPASERGEGGFGSTGLS